MKQIKNLNKTEERTMNYILRTMYKLTCKKLHVVDCQGMTIKEYQDMIVCNKKNGFLAVKPPFLFAGRERYNDFAVHHPSLNHSYAIECKLRTTSTVSPNEFHREVQIRKDNVLEKAMWFFIDGKSTKVKNKTLASLTDNCKLVHSLNDLVLK